MTSQSQITLPKNILHCPHSLKNLYHQSRNLKEGIGLNMSYVAFILLIFLISRFILLLLPSVQFSHSVMFDSVTPWTAACQASLSITSSWSLLKLMSIELVMSSNHLIPSFLLLPPSVFPSIRVFSNESALLIRWPKY